MAKKSEESSVFNKMITLENMIKFLFMLIAVISGTITGMTWLDKRIDDKISEKITLNLDKVIDNRFSEFIFDLKTIKSDIVYMNANISENESDIRTLSVRSDYHEFVTKDIIASFLRKKYSEFIKPDDLSFESRKNIKKQN